jgi:hypothetical protein
MLQKVPDIMVSSILGPTHMPAVMEFMKTTGLGYKSDLRADDSIRSESEEERRDGSERREEGVAVERESEVADKEERVEEEDEDEWRFGSFE